MTCTAEQTATPEQPPLYVGAGTLSGRRGRSKGAFDFEIRVRLSPAEARLLRCLPLVGNCVRQWRVPLSGSDWRPHPTMPGADIQLGAT